MYGPKVAKALDDCMPVIGDAVAKGLKKSYKSL